MKSVARKREHDPVDDGGPPGKAGPVAPAAVSQDVGTITRSDGPLFAVRTPSGALVGAKRAASCLLEPRVGDRVLVGGSLREGMYVLAILEREEGGRAAVVALDGDMELRLGSGRFVVAARDGVELVSEGDVSVVSGRVNVNAADGNVALGRLTFLGTFVRAEVERIKLFAVSLDAVVERITERVKRSYRSVEESDQLRAERIDYAAQRTMSLHAENALLTAEELVKIDGEQIHVG